MSKRVYAYEPHLYEHRQDAPPTRVQYSFKRGEVQVVPDDVAEIVTSAHPTRLVILGEFQAPPGLETPPVVPIEAPPAPPMPVRAVRAYRKGSKAKG